MLVSHFVWRNSQWPCWKQWEQNLVMRYFEGLIQNPLKQIRFFPVTILYDCYLLLLFFPCQGLHDLKQHTVILLWSFLPQTFEIAWRRMRNYITELGRAPQRSKRPNLQGSVSTCCALHSSQGLFLAGDDSLTFACCSLCHKVCLPSRSKEPTHGNLCCGWPCTLPEPLLCGHHYDLAKLGRKARRRGWYGFYCTL